MVATEHMIQGFSYTKGASYYNAFHTHDSGFCYLEKVANYEKMELVEAADTEVGTQVVDIGQQ